MINIVYEQRMDDQEDCACAFLFKCVLEIYGAKQKYLQKKILLLESIFFEKEIPAFKFFSIDTFFRNFMAKYKENSIKRESEIKKISYRPTRRKSATEIKVHFVQFRLDQSVN